MSRKLAIVLSVLEDSQRERLRSAAEKNGFEALFFENDDDALPHIADAEIILGQSAVLAKNSPALRWLCTPSAGVNQFTAADTFASPQAVLTNSSGAYGVTISEHVIMVILEVLRRQMDYTAIVERRSWQRDLPVRSILGSRITLLGTGDIGKETAVRLRSFRPLWICGVNRSGQNPDGLFDRVICEDGLEEVLPQSDIIVISLPGTKETYHMLDASRLALLPEKALVVNVGRGSVIDQKALEAELRSERLYAALDVFETEPLPQQDTLWTCPNLLMAPHVAGNMTLPYTRERIVSLFLEDFERYCDGKPLRRQVDLRRGY